MGIGTHFGDAPRVLPDSSRRSQGGRGRESGGDGRAGVLRVRVPESARRDRGEGARAVRIMSAAPIRAY